jgi:hypothetical protein
LSEQCTPGGASPLRRILPRIILPAWPDGEIDLRSQWAEGSLVLVVNRGVPRTHLGVERYRARIRTWDRARGELADLGYDLAFLATQPLSEHVQAIADLAAGFRVLSDPRLELLAYWPLAMVEDDTGGLAYKDLSILLHGGEVSHLFAASQSPPGVLAFIRQVHDA